MIILHLLPLFVVVWILSVIIEMEKKRIKDGFTFVRLWNVKELQRMGNDPNYALLSPNTIYVTRIILRKGKYRIDCMQYFEFLYRSEK